MVAVKYIKTAATLIAAVVDAAHDYGVKVYSVDTRSWKSKILGSSKSTGYAPNLSSSTRKDTSIFFVQRKYKIDISYIVQRGKNKGQTRYNDNIADAICMALYGFLDEKTKKLQLEA